MSPQTQFESDHLSDTSNTIAAQKQKFAKRSQEVIENKEKSTNRNPRITRGEPTKTQEKPKKTGPGTPLPAARRNLPKKKRTRQTNPFTVNKPLNPNLEPNPQVRLPIPFAFSQVRLRPKFAIRTHQINPNHHVRPHPRNPSAKMKPLPRLYPRV